MKFHAWESSWTLLHLRHSFTDGCCIGAAIHRMHASYRSLRIEICSKAILSAGLVAAVFGQSNLGSIQGTVVGADGTPLPGARVFAAIKATSQKTKAPPTLMNSVQGAGIAESSLKSPASTFLISKLPAGSYILCAQTASPGWLDPCHWSANVPVITLSAGQNLTGQTVVIAKGAVIQIRIVDPSKMLSARPGPIPRDVEIIAHASNNAYYNAQLASTDAIGQYRQLTLPFDQPHSLVVRSQQFSLLDGVGAAVPLAGETQSIQIPASASAPQFTYTVVGKAH